MWSQTCLFHSSCNIFRPGELGKTFQILTKVIAERLSERWHESYCLIANWIKVELSCSILRDTIMCRRWARRRWRSASESLESIQKYYLILLSVFVHLIVIFYFIKKIMFNLKIIYWTPQWTIIYFLVSICFENWVRDNVLSILKKVLPKTKNLHVGFVLVTTYSSVLVWYVEMSSKLFNNVLICTGVLMLSLCPVLVFFSFYLSLRPSNANRWLIRTRLSLYFSSIVFATEQEN